MASMKPLLRPQHLRGVCSAITTTTTTTTPLTIPQLVLLQSSTRSKSTTRAASTTSTPKPPQIPSPTPLVPDVETFLTVIGRDLKQHASKFPSWDSLFTLTSEELRELGVEPPRSRRYLLQWCRRFREGKYGVAGDLRHVKDGVAHLRVLTAPPGSGNDPTATPRKFAVNVPEGRAVKDCDPAELARVRGYRVKGAHTIVGPYALPLKLNKGSSITVTEGMWEDVRGHKIDGGERRRVEVRYKRRIAERREARERAEQG
ncbi:IGR protein motif-domain-containing protein [Xylaria cf. heliscus]|nr:IGR protein motif-domain-containing protein [Xylaria cf. heliscus]